MSTKIGAKFEAQEEFSREFDIVFMGSGQEKHRKQKNKLESDGKDCG
ncbi:MAG: hypothetical protein GY861_07630 [bacterium]|nr:hypothetical protein [bacterium]